MVDLYRWILPATATEGPADFLMDLVIKSSCLLLLACMLSLALRRASASARELLWRGALICVSDRPTLLPGL